MVTPSINAIPSDLFSDKLYPFFFKNNLVATYAVCLFPSVKICFLVIFCRMKTAFSQMLEYNSCPNNTCLGC